MIRRKLDRWQVSLFSAIMLMLAVILGLAMGGQAVFAWSPGPAQNVVVDNGYSFSGKDIHGTERPMLTLVNTNAIRLNAPPAGAIFFTVANTEMMRLSNSGNLGINDITPTEGKLVVRNTISGNGVYSVSHDANGVAGISSSGNGLYGISTSAMGVCGVSSDGYGVGGRSTNNYAGYFEGRIKVDGPIATAYRLSGINTAVDETDSIVAVNASVAPLTVTLPTAAGIEGRTYTIKRVNASNNVTIDPDGSQTIDGATTYTLSAQWDFITIISDGSNWLIVATN